jgi:hypothetical protein
MTASPSGDNPVERRVVELLREGLARRYEKEQLRQYREFDGFSDASLKDLQTFGLRYIYPDWEERAFQIRIFTKTMALLKSPQRLLALSKVTLKFLLRYGAQVPRAAQAGLQVLQAFDGTRKLEEQLFRHVEALRLAERIIEEGEAGLAPALAALTKETFKEYLEGLRTLATHLAQPRLLEAGETVLREIARTMEKRPDLYDEEEVQGALYAVQVLGEGRTLFQSLPEDQIDKAVAVIPKVEMDWIEKASQGNRG